MPVRSASSGMRSRNQAASVAAAGFRKIVRSDLKYPYLVLAGVSGLLLGVYLTTENYQWVLTLTGFDRNVLTLLPIATFLTALTTLRVLEISPSGEAVSAGSADAAASRTPIVVFGPFSDRAEAERALVAFIGRENASGAVIRDPDA